MSVLLLDVAHRACDEGTPSFRHDFDKLESAFAAFVVEQSQGPELRKREREATSSFPLSKASDEPLSTLPTLDDMQLATTSWTWDG